MGTIRRAKQSLGLLLLTLVAPASAGVVGDVFPPYIEVVPAVPQAYEAYQLEMIRPQVCLDPPVEITAERNGREIIYRIEATHFCANEPGGHPLMDGVPLPEGVYVFRFQVCFRDEPPSSCLPEFPRLVTITAASASVPQTVPASGRLAWLLLAGLVLGVAWRRVHDQG
jgi:hypothetical protein